MATKIEIVREDEIENILKITEKDIINLLMEDARSILCKYDFSDEYKFEYRNYIHKNIMLETDLGEDLFNKLMDFGYLTNEDVKSLTTKTYSNISKERLETLYEFIDWNKYILILVNDIDINVDKLFEVSKNINHKTFWNILSTISLPIDFLKEYKDRINWGIFFTTNTITNDIMLEFSDIFAENESGEPYLSGFGKLKEDDYLNYLNETNSLAEIKVDDIEDIINNNINNSNN